jgi:3-isopropylmalate/(R)-2-methylmalate dehydratase large subunit
MRVSLSGALPPFVSSKDFCLKLIGDLGQDGGLYASIEFDGPGIHGLSLESRMVIPNMMAEFGAKNAYLPPDQAVFDYLNARLARRGESTRVSRETALYPDANARYVSRHAYDLSALEPMVARPHRVDNVAPVSALKGVKVQQAWLGTCTNGRLEDIAAACEILRGKQVARGVRLLWNPASSEVLKDAMRLGHAETFVDAGGHINTPGCGPCMGNHMGIPAPGEVTISSANRNFQGRMGTRDSAIYLASPAVVAASALTGEISDPRQIVG